MAKKKNLIKGANKRKATPKFRYEGGGESYALPTSMNATTSNMMGLGDPIMLNAALARSTEALKAQKEQAELEKEQNLEARVQQSQEQFQNAVQQNQQQASTGLMDGLQAGMQANRLAKISQGTARAGQVARASSDTGQLLTNLGNYGTQAQSAGRLANAGQAIGQGVKAMGPAAGAAGLGIAGSFIEHKSDDLDPTTMNFGETTGKMMKGAGMGLSLASLAPLAAIPGIGWIGAGVGALGYGLHGLVQRNKARKEQEQIDQENEIARINMSRGMTNAFNNAFTKTGSDMGFNIGNSMTNSYVPSQQIMYKDGGKKVPGGEIVPLKGGAVEFKGASHDKGGILIDSQTEVEGGETMDQVQMKEGGMSEYIFSDHLKLGGKSFGQRHKEILKRGGGQREIQNLAKLQELVASREAEDTRGRTPEKIMKNGGVKQYQDGDFVGVIPNPNLIDQYELDFENAFALPLPTGQSITEEGLYRREDGDPVSLAEMERFKSSNPWFDFTDFDPANKEDVERFQKEFNKNVPETVKIAVDGKLGEQTISAYIPYRKKSQPQEQPPAVQAETPEGPAPEKAAEETGSIYPDTELNFPESPGLGRVPKELALLGLAGLQRNPPAPTARTATAQGARMANLPRINLNAERAANAAMNVGTRRQLADQVGGPAGMAATLAANRQAAQQNLNIAQQEAQANTGLMAQEAALNSRIGLQNAAQAQQASMFNASNLSRSDLERYQQNILDRQRNKDVIAGVGRDLLEYSAKERQANALDAFGAYAAEMGDKFIQSQNTQQSKYGGYISRSNKIRRKRRK